MVDVRVGQQDGVDVSRPHGAGFPVAVEEFAFLEHAAIDEDFRPVAADVVLRAGHFPGRAEKLKFHVLISQGVENRGKAQGKPDCRVSRHGDYRRRGGGWQPGAAWPPIARPCFPRAAYMGDSRGTNS